MGLLHNRVWVITGGASSVGLASARLFLDEGAKVMLVDLDDAALARAVTDLASPHAERWVTPRRGRPDSSTPARRPPG